MANSQSDSQAARLKVILGMTKRVLDVVISLIVLVLLSPVLVVVMILIRRRLGSPVFFVQERSGKDGVRFAMIKFRTMTNAVDESGQLLPNADRMTKFGNLLRKTSLDELPELLNVLKGEMSLVGPRPLLPEYDALYSPNHARRLSVRPGLTGWAQVNGRSASDWSARFDQDVWYVENQSILLDFRIMFLTAKKVLMRDDVTTPDQNKRFEGYEDD